MEPSKLLAPEYVARKFFRPAKGKKKSGQSITVYSWTRPFHPLLG
jgi:hypothetical protein